MTPERFSRIQEILSARQTDLTLCLEKVHKPNNLSAIIRTADAVGVPKVHAIWPKNSKMRMLGKTSAGARNWVDVEIHDSTPEAFSSLKQQGMQIIATHLSDSAVDFREIDYTKPTAIVMGEEKFGTSEQALALADHHVIIPMMGMVQSLNVSVACALIMYEAQRQRNLADLYQSPRYPLSDAEIQTTLFERGYPVLARVAKLKGMPYPIIDEQGQIIASDDWWAQMQASKSKR